MNPKIKKLFKQSALFIINNIVLPKFRNRPKNFRLVLPFRIVGSSKIYIGDNVYIGGNSNIATISRDIDGTEYNPEIIIGNNVNATSALQIHATRRIEIGDDVLIASNVFIVSCSHGYERTDIPYIMQPLFKHGDVKIGRGCWIGQNVVILQGVSIGEMCIIGANSVVTDNIPSFCIAVGTPAKPIKRWDSEFRRWVKVKSENV